MRSSAGQSGGAYDYSISLATLLQITKRLNARDETLDVDYWQGLLKRLTVQAQPRTLHVARAGLDWTGLLAHACCTPMLSPYGTGAVCFVAVRISGTVFRCVHSVGRLA
jgi:hypothetical protein